MIGSILICILVRAGSIIALRENMPRSQIDFTSANVSGTLRGIDGRTDRCRSHTTSHEHIGGVLVYKDGNLRD